MNLIIFGTPYTCHPPQNYLHETTVADNTLCVYTHACTLKDTVHRRSLCMQGSQGDKQCWLCNQYWGGRQVSYETAYLWYCATPSTLHTTRIWFWHTATCAVSRSKPIICAINFFLRRRDQYNARDTPKEPGPAHAANTWLITVRAPPTN